MERMCLYGWLLMGKESPLLSSYCLYSASIHFGRAEVAYCLTNLEATAWHGELHIAIVYFKYSPHYYLRVQLMYHEELYTECNGTTQACMMNSGYQALPF